MRRHTCSAHSGISRLPVDVRSRKKSFSPLDTMLGERASTQTSTTVCSARDEQPSGSADTVALIVAGGLGLRFGDPTGKQFVELCGLPVLSWSLIAFDHAPSISQLVIVCESRKRPLVEEEILGKLVLKKPVFFAEAGTTRQESVYSGISLISEQSLRAKQTSDRSDALPFSPLTESTECIPLSGKFIEPIKHAYPHSIASRADTCETETETLISTHRYVAVHDAARPLIETQVIEDVISHLRANPNVTGAILAHPATDTLKLVNNRSIISTPDRRYYWCAETPQVFYTKALRAAYAAARWEGYEGTDDASLVEHHGGTVETVLSDRLNIKITHPEDLVLVEAIMNQRLIGDL